MWFLKRKKSTIFEIILRQLEKWENYKKIYYQKAMVVPVLKTNYFWFQNMIKQLIKSLEEKDINIISDCLIHTDFLTALSLNTFFQSKWWKLSLFSWNLVDMMFKFKQSNCMLLCLSSYGNFIQLWSEADPIIDGTNCRPKAVLVYRSINLVFVSGILHQNFWFFNSIYHPTAWQIKNPLKRNNS